MNAVDSKKQRGARALGKEFIEGVHRPIQKYFLLVAAPMGLVVFAYLAWVNPVWQGFVLFAGLILILSSWVLGYRLLQRNKNSASVACYTVPIVLQGVLCIVLFDGYGTAALWPMLTATVYAGFFSRRLMLFCGVLMSLGPILGVSVKQFDIYPLLPVETAHEVLPRLLMGLSAGVIVGFLLKRSLDLRAGVFHSLGSANKEQQRFLATIRNIQPEIDGEVQEIKQISSKMAAQSAEQASSTSEMTATVVFMRENAGATATSAAETESVARKTQDSSLESNERLIKIEQSFDQIVGAISTAAEEVTELSQQMERIEEILQFNRKIGENIKVLAINAAIEADRAGDLGQGFSAVAAEFREMIRDTEQNLASSSVLLQKIRDQARESSLIIIDGSQGLSRYFNELRAAGKSLKQNTDRFYTTSMQVAEITKAAKKQRESVTVVSVAMEELDGASFDLKDSAAVLLDVVDTIVASQQRLDKVLEIG